MRTRAFLLGLLLTAPAAAQTPSLLAARPIGVFASDGSSVDYQSVNARTVLSRGILLAAARGTAAGASLSISPAHTTAGPGWQIRESASVSATTRAPAAGTADTLLPTTRNAAHVLDLVLGSTTRTRSLQLDLGGSAIGGATAEVLVDIGADSRIDWTRRVDGSRHQVTLPLPRTDTVVRIALRGLARLGINAKSAAYSATLTARVAVAGDAPCGVKTFGGVCGTRLGGADTAVNGGHRIVFALTGTRALQPVLWVMGSTQVRIQLPGTSCPLLTVPLAATGTVADLGGSSTLRFDSPSALDGLAIVQAIPFTLSSSGLRVDASNGLILDCDT